MNDPLTMFLRSVWSNPNCSFSREIKVTTYNDLTPMPFGKHVGTPLQDVPPAYLHWLWTTRPLSDKRLEDYIKRSIPALKKELPDAIWS